LVPTIMDSTADSSGVLEFRVIAAMDEGNFASPVLTGYSVDNLFPSIPTGLLAIQNESGIQLTWTSNSAPDLKYYTVYKSIEGSSFEKSGITIDTSFIDTEINSDHYYYAISATDFSGNETEYSNPAYIVISDIEDKKSVPQYFYLENNYPNPFNPNTIIPYGLKDQSNVSIIIFDVLGTKIKEFQIENQKAGHYQIIWDGTNNNNQRVSAGNYFYQLKTSKYVSTKKMLYLK
jgi:FlgD Ig-like domain